MVNVICECADGGIAKYVDNTSHVWITRLTILVAVTFPLSSLNLRLPLQNFSNWFDNNHLIANPGKCHLLLSFKSPQILSIGGKTL